MSDLVVSDPGASQALDAYRTAVNGLLLVMRLFSNNFTPTKASSVGDFTQCAFTGYVPITVNAFALPTVAGHVATSLHPLVTWTVTGASPGEQVYGYYVTDGAGTVVYWSERYDLAPAPMDTAGQTFSVTPQLSSESEFG